MKRLIIATAILVCVGGVASAQTATRSASTTTRGVSKTTKVKNVKKKKGKLVKTDTMNQRRNYIWKDGQRATPTGHEASSTGGTNTAVNRKDTGRVIKQ